MPPPTTAQWKEIDWSAKHSRYPTMPTLPTSFTAGSFDVLLRDHYLSGDIHDLYHCTYKSNASVPTTESSRYSRVGWFPGDPEPRLPGVLKVVSSMEDNDLARNEIETLRKIWPAGTPEINMYRYLPNLLGTQVLEGRQALLFPSLVGSYYSLEEVRVAYPNGIDYRDMAWMFKRTLEILSFVHDQGVFHTAVLPSHIMVCPRTHGVKLIDWSYSIKMGEGWKAIPSKFEPYYGVISSKSKPTEAFDVGLLFKSMLAVLGDLSKVPPEVVDFLQANPPHNRSYFYAVTTLEEFTKLMEKLVGKPTFRTFVMP